MKVTYTLRNLSSEFLQELAGIGDLERFRALAKYSHGDLKHLIKQKIGTGQFRDVVELQKILQSVKSIDAKIEPRRGYNLVTFEIL